MTSPEHRYSRRMDWLIAVSVASLMLLGSDFLQPPGDQPFPGHGERFASMAEDPVAFDGAFPQRVLWPALAWLFSCVGVGAVAFSQICSAAFLAVVCWFGRQRTGSWASASLLCAAMAVSGAVLVYKPMACYSDSLNLLILVLLVHFAARPRVFWCLVLLSALSHELVFFFSPWLLYLRCRNGGAIIRDGASLVVCVVLYLAWRSLTRGDYDSSYYFENNFWLPWCMPAMWALWAFEVLVEFGPLLVVMSFGIGRGGALMERDCLGGRWGLCLYLAGILPLMVLAYDVMRFATFMFLPIMLAGLDLVGRRHGRQWLLALVIAAAAIYAWTHPVASEQGGRLFTEVASHILQLIPGRVEPTQPMAPEHAYSFTMALLARWWQLSLCSLLAFAAMAVLGQRLRRQLA